MKKIRNLNKRNWENKRKIETQMKKNWERKIERQIEKNSNIKENEVKKS